MRGVEAARRLHPGKTILLPGITDKPELLEEVVRAARAAGATGIWSNLLNLRPGTKEHFLEALAQDWPGTGKTIQLIVPAPGGSGTGDTIARVLAEELQSRLKTTFVVDNKAGANGNIGAGAAAATPGDGYHFLFSWAGTLAVKSGQIVKQTPEAMHVKTPGALLVVRGTEFVVRADGGGS